MNYLSAAARNESGLNQLALEATSITHEAVKTVSSKQGPALSLSQRGDATKHTSGVQERFQAASTEHKCTL
jgi:hypothetical protein